MRPIRARKRIFSIIVTDNESKETDTRTMLIRGPQGHTILPSFIDFGHIFREISGADDAHYRVTGQIRARKRIFRITVTGNDGTETGPRAWRIRCPPNTTSLSSFIDFGHILGEISFAEDARNRVTGPLRASKLIFRITVTGKDGTETGPRTWRMSGPLGHTSLTSFIDFGHIFREISGADDAHYRVTGPIRARKRIFQITVTGNDGTETGPRTWRIRCTPNTTSLSSFIDFGHILGEISFAEDAHYRETGPIRARKRIFCITVTGKDGTETGQRTWRICCSPGTTSLSSFIDFGHILGDISGAEDAHYRVTRPIRARKRIFRITVTGNDGNETGPRTLRMLVVISLLSDVVRH
ncbi:hypothetical protein DPMN_186663 [Dreissena polymorpha]|uniref:Uncharacterized protein n=1 Tax=Dreissena polymorpha TaxID=45954 RepID=A0A9D4DP40_DREPO|nr:hypothetical protein DPMN_186663 [Dreissena polymorpha]